MRITEAIYPKGTSDIKYVTAFLYIVSYNINKQPHIYKNLSPILVCSGATIIIICTNILSFVCCSGEEATSHLLNLSPFELKKLLHHIISGKEFVIQEGMCKNQHMLVGASLYISSMAKIQTHRYMMWDI